MSVQDERFETLLGAAAPLVAAVFDALPDAMGVVWPTFDGAGALVDFEIGYTNPSSERMMGVRLRDEVGARLREVMPGVVPMGLYDRLLRVAETREAESAEITLDTMWRDAIHVRGVWVHTVLPFGSGLMSVAFDVSEERRRENELRDFAAVAAHDLREPLLGVHVMASLLGRRGGLGVEEQEMVRLLDDGVKRATSLVDSILEYATATDDGASRTEVDCGEVVSEVLATLASQIEHVDGRVEVGALPIVQASRPGLFRVFQNLIANAFKFHNGDAPHVTVSARHGDAGWAFSVRDNGIGLPKDSAIFEMFKRGGGEHEGSGIGLATCRRIVEAHGGRIWAEPAPRGGSTFSSRSRFETRPPPPLIQRTTREHHRRSRNAVSLCATCERLLTVVSDDRLGRSASAPSAPTHRGSQKARAACGRRAATRSPRDGTPAGRRGGFSARQTTSFRGRTPQAIRYPRDGVHSSAC